MLGRKKARDDMWEEAQLAPRTKNGWSLRTVLFNILVVGFCLWQVYAWLPDLSHHQPSALDEHCTRILDPPEGYYASRLDRLAKALSEEGSTGTTWIAEPGPSAEYFLGTFGSRHWHLSERPFLIAITPSSEGEARITLVTPEFERLRAQEIQLPEEVESKVEWVSWQEDQSAYLALAGAVNATKVLFDDMVRSFITIGVQKAVGGDPAGERVKEAVSYLRERKDEREIDLLRCANQKTLHAIRKTRDRMYIGISESQTSLMLKEEMRKTGLTGGDGLVLFGEDAALPHGTGTDKKLGKHDLVLIDAGGTWGGYVSDITRTFALRKSDIPRKHVDTWEAVRKAQFAPYELLLSSNATHPPLLGSLDHAARTVIHSYMTTPSDSLAASPAADFTFLTHRLGHGIGLEGHERPYLVPGDVGRKVVQTGNVFSLEPGVYVPRHSRGESYAKGLNGVGIRLEDCFVVTEREHGRLGGEWLSGPVRAWGDI